MPTTILSGLVDEQDVLADEKPPDMDSRMQMLDPDSTQFTTFLMRARSKPASNPKVQWLEDQLMPRVTTVATSATSATTSIVVATGTGDYFRAGDIVRVPTSGEAFRVSSISTDTLTVVRGLGAVTANTAQTGVQLVIVDNASAEGATLSVRKITKPAAAYNYTQIFRHSFGFTNTAAATRFFAGGQPEREQVKKLTEHKRSIEAGLFFGPRSIDTTGATPIRTMGGCVEFITTNVFNTAGSLTADLLDTYLMNALAHGSDSRMIFAAPIVGKATSGFLRAAWSPNTTKDELFGAKVSGYVSGTYGTNVPIIVKREWSEFSATGVNYGTYAFILDLDKTFYRPLRTTIVKKDVQANDADETTHEFVTEASFQISNESAHAIVKGVTG